MKQRIVNLLKYNKAVYSVYYYIMSLAVNVMKWFVRCDDRLILFNSYAGRKYDDSPKAVFEAMKRDPRFRDCTFVWAFHHPEKFHVEGARTIKTDGMEYFRTALAARVWVTNSSMERGLHFKGRKTFYLNTWHGSPIKKMGTDIGKDNQSFAPKGGNLIDCMNTQSRFEAEIFSNCFSIPRDHFIEVGLPRNDELAHASEQKRKELRKKLNIPDGVKVILYCPTFREYAKDERLGVVLAPPMHPAKWEKELKGQYLLLFRAHYEVTKVMGIQETEFVRNVTDYPSLNDLMIASDLLISDYSSIFFDYSIMDKCMLHFTYDYDEYEAKRGMYFDIRDYLSGAASEDGLIELLKTLSLPDEIEKTQRFRKRYVNYYGEAAERTADRIAREIL